MTDKLAIFQLFQSKFPLTIKDGDNSVDVLIWKPTTEEARVGQLYLVDRIAHWENQKEDLLKRVQAFIAEVPDDKAAIIQRILDETLAQRIAENIDLIDSQARLLLEREYLHKLTAKDLESWDPHLNAEAGLHSIKLEKGDDLSRDHVLRLVGKKDEFSAYLDEALVDPISARFREEETKKYGESDLETLRAALMKINKRTLAYAQALQEWSYMMLCKLVRLPNEESPGKRGEANLCLDEGEENFIGNLSDPVMMELMRGLGMVMKLGRTEEIRRLAGDGNFTSSAKSPGNSDSHPQGPVVPPILPTTPTT